MMPAFVSAWRRWLPSAVFALVLIAAAWWQRARLGAWFGGGEAHVGGTALSAVPNGGGDISHYTCSMHPSVKQPGPGKCPICGMDLTAVTKAQQEQGLVFIDEARRQLIGVKTAPVIDGPLSRSLRAVGRVAYDESTLTDVNLKVSGWISKLLVNKTGQRVAAGQTLFTFYSPELYNAQQDFLLALRSGATATALGGAANRGDGLSRAARQRLHLLGMSDGQIAALEARGTPSESLAVPSPASGFVIEKDVVEGAAVEAGMRLFRIAALNKVWVEAELYEADLARTRVGQDAQVSLDYLPGRTYEAKIAYVYPSVDPTARTGRVRVELSNKELELRPGMFATVELTGETESRLQVPAAAVVYTGPRRLVFLDLGDGRFAPREVQVGQQSNGMYEVLSGLGAGDIVATSGVFLIAAEARISTAAQYWDKAPEPTSSAVPLAPPATKASAAPSQHAHAHAAASSKPPAAIVYTCPMHPEVRSPSPGQCPRCGMNLEPSAGGAPK
jgi:membrane fusion protein, copper/silver efflux system